MKKGFYIFTLLFAFLFSCGRAEIKIEQKLAHQKQQIIVLLDGFNKAASDADFEKYFNYYSEDALFIGTDATERWDKKSFMKWAKPYFDQHKTWHYTSLERHIYFDKKNRIAWFDELLKTQMKICRGSGILVKKNGEWKIKQYVLSMTIPNNTADTIIKIKAPIEDALIEQLTLNPNLK